MPFDEKLLKESQKINKELDNFKPDKKFISGDGPDKKVSKNSDLAKSKYKLWDLTNSSTSGYEVASIGIRLLALFFDFVFGIILLVIITIPFQFIDNLSPRASGILGGFVIFSVRAFFQGNSGQSLGQRVLKLKVSGQNPMNYSDAIIRNFICLIFVAVPFAGLVLLINTSVNKNSQGWHDKAAKSWIVRKNR
jgi:uncharacterized RDD family membrane protein YckC